MNPIAQNVLDYWFGEMPVTPEQNEELGKKWFGGGKDLDYDIERRFGKLVSTARKGAFDLWEKQPDECLALIVLLDQFPRNLYRATAEAFASDTKALELSRALVKNDNLEKLGYCEQAIALMPYQHVEDLDLQVEGVAIYRKQADSAPEEWQKIMRGYADFAQKHCDIIEQFGRFPHRNEAMQRESTAEEIDYLKGGGARFGQ